MLKFIHAADLHADCVFSGLTPDKAAALRQKHRQALARLPELAREEAADFMLVSGDLFDHNSVSYDTVSFLSELFRRTPCPVYACTGNHDYFTPACAYNSVAWPDNFHLFHTPRIEGIPFRDGVTVWGAGFQTNAVEAPMLEGFHCEGGMNIMTLHGDCYTLTTRSNPIPPKLIETSGLTYLALGHVHTRRPAAKLGNTTYAYTGSFFGCGFDEPDERGVLVVTIADDGAADTRFVAMSDTCFRNAHLDVTGKREEEMADEIAAFASHDVYRIYLEGEREVPDIGALTKKCAQHFFHLVLIDRTVPPVDLWEGIEEENLKGEFLRRARAAYDAETDSARKSMLLEAARAGIEALR